MAAIALAACSFSPLTNRIKVGEEDIVVFVGEGPDGNTDLFVSNASGGTPTQLTYTVAIEMLPRITADGVVLAFVRTPDSTGIGGRVVLMNLLNGNERSVAIPGDAGPPVGLGWSSSHDAIYLRTRNATWRAPAPPAEMTLERVAVPTPAADSALARGAWNRVAVLVGSNADEGTAFVREAPATVAAYHELLGASGFGDTSGALARAYPVHDSTEILRAVQRIVGESGFGAPSRSFARLVTRHGGRAYLYHFTRVGESDAARALGATHAAEIGFVVGQPPSAASRYGSTPYDARLAEAMSDYWVAFATSGDPNGAPSAGKWPRWPAYDARADTYLELGPEIAARRGLLKTEYDVLDALARSRGEVRP
jgi:hypothetical protein